MKFSIMENSVQTRVKAALPDDAPVDFSLWALPNETPVIANYRSFLQCYATKWWA